MKVNFEKCVFYFMIIAVSGSIGYALKPEPEIQQPRTTQIRECVQAIHMMNEFSKKNYYKPKTKKEWAIERMMKN
jgi:hypothetical protein